MLKIDYHTFNNIILHGDNLHILDYNIEDRILKRWGICQLISQPGYFRYHVEFVSDKHETMFQLQFGKWL